MALRTFTDPSGLEWRVWNVDRVPLAGRAEFLDSEYQNGWLAFECEASGERRRLGAFPDDWNAMSESQLLRLWDAARPVVRAGEVTARNEVDPRL